MEITEICGLKGIGTGTKSHRLIPLENREQVVIGRTTENDVVIDSNMISRKHAVLQKSGEEWTITDNKSLNGVHVNNKRLAGSVPYTLVEGDQVQLGVQTKKSQLPDFLWIFHSKVKVKKKKPSGNSQTGYSQDSESQTNTSKTTSGSHSNNRKRPVEDRENTPSPRKQRKRLCMSEISPSWSPSAEMKRRAKEQEQKVKKQLAEQQEQLEQMQRLLAQRDMAQENLQKELQEKEQAMKEQLHKQQNLLEEQQKKFEEDLRHNYEVQLKDKEDLLFHKLTEEKEQLLKEKRLIEESLHTEMEQKLNEKDKSYQENLVKEKEKLDKIIEQKEVHRKMLETQLNETKNENKMQKETALQTKEDILSNFTDLIETELQCSICNELFVKATSLNCSHSYCAMCIEEWMKVKKECPVCRCAITSSIKSIVLDNYIDSMVQHLSEDMKQRRLELVNERKAERLKKEAASKPSAPPNSSPRGGRGRGRRGGRGGGRGGTRSSTPPPVSDNTAGTSGIGTRSRVAADAIVVSSDNDPDIDDVGAFVDLGSDFTDEASSNNDDANDDSDDDSDDVEGVDGAYYGGYGSCYRCGSHGHWANGCPHY